MESFTATLGVSVVLFAATNVDDLFVLLGFFSDPGFRSSHVVIGQYAGIILVYGMSVLASLLSIVVSPTYFGLLGLVPIFLGVVKLYELWRAEDSNSDQPGNHAAASPRASRNILTVTMATVANSGDNMSVYTPVFATRPALHVAVTGLVFAAMTGLWCLVGHWLVHHPALGRPIRRYGHRIIPFMLIGCGILILYKAGLIDFT